MKHALKLSLILGTALCISAPVSAEDRNLSEAEINQLFEDLFLKETSIVNTDDMELEDKQREEISEQIVFHYTDNALIKLKDVALTEKNHKLPIYRAKFDRAAYENMLEVETKLKNLQVEFDIKNIDYRGQRAVVDIDTIYTYQVDATEYSDITKVKADVITKAKCETHIRIDYDDIARIENENCDMNTFISNIEIDRPEYLQDQQGTAEIKFGAETIFKR